MDDGLNNVRAAQFAFEQALTRWIATRLEYMYEVEDSAVVAEYVVVARMRGIDGDGNFFGYPTPSVHEPLGQETWVSRVMLEKALNAVATTEVQESIAYLSAGVEEDEEDG